MDSDRLDGWKEIAAHLHRDVRTCQRWEKEYGLPVYRVDNQSDRAKVFSYKSELNNWLLSKRKSDSLFHRFFKKTGNQIILLAVTIALLALVIYMIFPSLTGFRSHPTQWELKGNNIVFLDNEDNILWAVEVDHPGDLAPYYKDSEDKLIGQIGEERFKRSRIHLSDMDGDNKNEAVVALRHDHHDSRCVDLYDYNGKKMWSKRVCLEQEYPTETASFGFVVNKVEFVDIDGDGKKEVAVLWVSDGRFPSLFLIYDREGNEIFRYTHTGVLQTFAHSAAKDGSRLIWLLGTNNLLEGDAVVSVLDCGRLRSGVAPPYDIDFKRAVNPEGLRQYIPENPVRAYQKYYFRFLKNDFCRALDVQYMYAYRISMSEEGISLSVNYQRGEFWPIHFNFGPDLKLNEIQPSLDYRINYPKLLDQGIAKKPLDEFLDSLKNEVLFWTGTGWTLEPFELN